MATVTAALVKELRERTGAGMMECKKALVEANADIELAIENMRKSGAAKAAKKAGNVAAEGAIIIKEENGVAVLLEVNCQTDFVAKDENFAGFSAKVAAAALAAAPARISCAICAAADISPCVKASARVICLFRCALLYASSLPTSAKASFCFA